MKFVIFPIYRGTVIGKNLNVSENKKCLKQKPQRGGICIFLSSTLFHKSYTFWCNSKVLSNAPELLLCVQIPQYVHFAVSSVRSLVMFNFLI